MLLGLLSRAYQPKNNTRRGGMNYIGSHGYLAYGEEELDAVFVGCSEFYASVSPLYLWEHWGITSYNASSGAQRIYQSDDYVHSILKAHRPRLILLDGYAVVREGYCDDALFGMAAQYWPVFHYHNNWKQFSWKMMTAPLRYTNRVEGKGYRPEDKVVPVDMDGYMEARDGTERFPLLNRLYLRHIRNVCRAHGVTLAVVVIPSPANWNGWYSDALKQETDRLGIPLVDLNDHLEELGLDPATDFRDEGDHLNVSGAEKVSGFLGALLRETYHLPDHRGDPAFDTWDRELEKHQS